MNEADLQLQWIALRYAVDMIDEAWSHNYEYNSSDPKLLETKTIEMKANRKVLIEMQDEVLAKTRALKQ